MKKRVFTFKMEQLIDAPREIVWKIISDIEGYANFTSFLKETKIIQGNRQGLVRRCVDHEGQFWHEECVVWRDGYQYSMVVDTSNYPYPFSYMQGTWTVEERPNGTFMKIQFDYMPKFGILNWLLDLFMIKKQFKKGTKELVDNWIKKIIEEKELASSGVMQQ